MGGYPSHSTVETVSDHCSQLAGGVRLFARQSWLATNQVCSNSICSAIWPTRWAQAAEDADISYLPVGGRRDDASGEAFIYSPESPATSAGAAASSRRPPMPYLSQPRDRALYAIEDEDDLPSSGHPQSGGVDLTPSPHSVPHYSYRPDLPPPSPQMPSGRERGDRRSNEHQGSSGKKSPKRSNKPRHTSQGDNDDPLGASHSGRGPSATLGLPASVSSSEYTPIGTPSPDVPTHPLATQQQDSSAAATSAFQSPPPVHVGGQATKVTTGDRVDARDLVRDDDDDTDIVLIDSPQAEAERKQKQQQKLPPTTETKSVADFDPLTSQANTTTHASSLKQHHTHPHSHTHSASKAKSRK